MNACTRIGLAAALSAGVCAGSSLAAQQPSAHPQPTRAATAQTPGTQNVGSPAAAAAPMSVVVLPVPVYEVKVRDVAAHPERYYGDMVSVNSEVADILGPNVFTLKDHRLLPGPDLIVVTPRPVKVKKGDAVRVIGHMRPLVIAQLGREYRWFRPSWFRDVRIDLQERPVVIAASVQTADGRELLPQAQ